MAVHQFGGIGRETAHGARHARSLHPTGGVAVAGNDRGILDLTRDAAHLRDTFHHTRIVTIVEVVALEHTAHDAAHLVATVDHAAVEGGLHMASR